MDQSSIQSNSPEDDGDVSVLDEKDAKKQANRACDACHRLKMKCINKENPPCNRCRQSGHDCTFNGPRKSKASRVEDRLRFVESQMGSMQGALEELIRLQRAAIPGAQQMVSHPMPESRPMLPQQTPFAQTEGGGYPTPQTMLALESFLNPAQSAPPTQPIQPSPHRIPSQTPLQHPTDPLYAGRPTLPPQWPPTAEAPAPSAKKVSRPRAPSPPSEDDDDEDDDVVSSLSSRPWDNMFYLAEAARLEQDGRIVSEVEDKEIFTGPRPERKQSTHPFDFHTGDTPGPPTKRRRKSKIRGADEEFAEIKRNLPLQRGDHVHQFKDCVELGYCDLEKAQKMFDVFMEGCLVYMPCFDPAVDTFESLRKRSPFSITTLVMVGAKVVDAGGAVSDLQRQCREHAERIGMSTLFSPVSRIEVVQGLIVLASWGDTSWRPGGHATRMAMDMGLYRCLPLLHQNGMGKGKSSKELKEEYPLVVGARVWLTLYKMEIEMAYNLGRPALISGDESIRFAKDFLTHPLSVLNDSRLVAACELLAARMSLHQPYALLPHGSITNLDETLAQHDKMLEEWFKYWNEWYGSRGIGQGNFYREALVTARCGAELYTNARILHGVRNKEDVARMPEFRRQRLIKARNAAESLVAMCLRGEEYTRNFPFANLYTHLHIAFAARCLIRLVSLLPQGANTRQIGRDVEKVAQALTKVPGFRYAMFLREVLNRARRHNVLPPPSKPPSPVRGSAPLPSTSKVFGDTPPNFSLGDSASGSGFSFGISPVENHGFDFGYAEQLFSAPGTQTRPDNSFYQSNGPSDQAYNLDAWFPFPPLESENPLQQLNTSDASSLAVAFDDASGKGQWW